MKQVVKLRAILESMFPKGSRLLSKKNTQFTKSKKRK